MTSCIHIILRYYSSNFLGLFHVEILGKVFSPKTLYLLYNYTCGLLLFFPFYNVVITTAVPLFMKTCLQPL